MIICGETMAKLYESIGLKVERPPIDSNLLQYIPTDA
jgi:hypothetical protein